MGIDLAITNHAIDSYGRNPLDKLVDVSLIEHQSKFNANDFSTLLSTNNLLTLFTSQITGDLAGAFGNIFNFESLAFVLSTIESGSNIASTCNTQAELAT